VSIPAVFCSDAEEGLAGFFETCLATPATRRSTSASYCPNPRPRMRSTRQTASWGFGGVVVTTVTSPPVPGSWGCGTPVDEAEGRNDRQTRVEDRA
jgi:hypothetical protein